MSLKLEQLLQDKKIFQKRLYLSNFNSVNIVIPTFFIALKCLGFGKVLRIFYINNKSLMNKEFTNT